jgi:type II secretory pathway pseudopilin PulG
MPADQRRTPPWVWGLGGLVAIAIVAGVIAIAAIAWLGSQDKSQEDTTATLAVQQTVSARQEQATLTAVAAAAVGTEPTATSPAPTEPRPTATPVPPDTPPPSMEDREAALLSGLRHREENGPPVFVYPRRQTIAIDGRLEEWPPRVYPVLHEFTDPDNPQLTGNRSGNSDLAGRLHTAWDRDAFYLGVEVTDDVHVQLETGAAMFKGDDIEIQIDADLLGDWADTSLSSDDGQVGFSAGDFGGLRPEAYIWRPPDREQPGTMIEVAARQTAQGYILEAAIPWPVMGIAPEIETPIGFCLSLSDNDTPGASQQETLLSTAPKRTWGDPTTWGTLILMAP